MPPTKKDTKPAKDVKPKAKKDPEAKEQKKAEQIALKEMKRLEKELKKSAAKALRAGSSDGGKMMAALRKFDDAV